MNGIKYYALDENEEVPYEFVVIRNVNGEPEFCASFVNTNSLAYENGALLKLHQRNDELRAENAELRELCVTVIDDWMSKVCPSFPFCEFGGEYQDCTDETCGNQIYRQMARELGVEVDG